MPLTEAKRLVEDVAKAKERRLEHLVEDLRAEFDTLHRVCRLLLEDLDRIDDRLMRAVSHDECAVVKGDLRSTSDHVNDLNNALASQERRIIQLETALELTTKRCEGIASSAATVINVTGAAVGRDVAGNVETK